MRRSAVRAVLLLISRAVPRPLTCRSYVQPVTRPSDWTDPVHGDADRLMVWELSLHGYGKQTDFEIPG
jgi:hypothetical protein